MWEILSVEQFGWRREVRDSVLDTISLRCFFENQTEMQASVVCMSLGSRSRLGCLSGSPEHMDR